MVFHVFGVVSASAVSKLRLIGLRTTGGNRTLGYGCGWDLVARNRAVWVKRQLAFVVELVDTPDSKSGASQRAGSNPAKRTREKSPPNGGTHPESRWSERIDE